MSFNIKNLSPVELNASDSLPSMTQSERKSAIALIRSLCCNYHNGDCVLLDCVCVQSISSTVLCKFFRHVLLESKEGFALKTELFGCEKTTTCKICGVNFKAEKNKAYCSPRCRNIGFRKNTAARVKKHRNSTE